MPRRRPLHLGLANGRSLNASFGFEWALRVADHSVNAARGLALEPRVMDVHHDETSDLYEPDAALIRPEQVGAWRGTATGDDARQIVARASGRKVEDSFRDAKEYQVLAQTANPPQPKGAHDQALDL